MASENFKQVMGHLGAILFHISIFGTILCGSVLVSNFAWLVVVVLIAVVDFILIFGTFGLALTNAGVRSFILNSFSAATGEQFVVLMKSILEAFPYMAIASGCISLLSIVFLCFDVKNQKSKIRLIVSICTAICLLFISFFGSIFVAGGAAL